MKLGWWGLITLCLIMIVLMIGVKPNNHTLLTNEIETIEHPCSQNFPGYAQPVKVWPTGPVLIGNQSSCHSERSLSGPVLNAVRSSCHSGSRPGGLPSEYIPRPEPKERDFIIDPNSGTLCSIETPPDRTDCYQFICPNSFSATSRCWRCGK